MNPIVPADFTKKNYSAEAWTYSQVEEFAEQSTRGQKTEVGDEGVIFEDGGWRKKATSFLGLVEYVRSLGASLAYLVSMVTGLRGMWPRFFTEYWQPSMQAIEREVGFDRLSTPRPNGIPNGGYQAWTGTLPNGWTLGGAGAATAQAAARPGAFADEFSVQITAGPAASATLSRSDLAFQPGSVHTLSGFVNINTSTNITIKVTTNSGTDVPQILNLTGGSNGVGAIGWFNFPRPMGYELTFLPNSDATAMTLTLTVVTFNGIAKFSSFSLGPGPMRDADLCIPAPEDLAGVTGDFNIPGKLTVGGLIDPTGLVLNDQASVPGGTPAAGYGTVWVKTDKTLHFTNSDGTDKDLSAAGGTAAWGGISGTLANQTDLQTALDAKAPTANPTFTGTVTIPDGALAIADTSGLQTALDAKQATSEKDAASGYAGLSSASRVTKGCITTDDLIVNIDTKGLVLKDNAGTPHYWRISVSTLGVLSTADLGTSVP